MDRCADVHLHVFACVGVYMRHADDPSTLLAPAPCNRFLRGCCYLSQGDAMLAMSDMSTVLKLQGTHLHARFMRAMANLDLGQTTAAMADLSQVLPNVMSHALFSVFLFCFVFLFHTDVCLLLLLFASLCRRWRKSCPSASSQGCPVQVPSLFLPWTNTVCTTSSGRLTPTVRT